MIREFDGSTEKAPTELTHDERQVLWNALFYRQHSVVGTDEHRIVDGLIRRLYEEWRDILH